MGGLRCCLMGSSPERPSDDVGGADLSSGEAGCYAPDFLKRPTNKRVGGSVFFGVLVIMLALRRMLCIMAKASITSETCRCQPCHDLVSL